MNVTLPSRTLLLLALAAPLQAAPTYVPWPSQVVLKTLQKEAFLCSLNNSPDQCERARQRADELMDHPRLPAICKDVLWSLVKESRVAATNSFQRRDAIDQPARRLIRVCSEPVKPSKKQAPTRT
ncbi:hypothetical protein N8463_01170 [Synechococcus sp. AH-601-P06]|jgi:hypothetical protein|nr:hypothetical protein [Synechococcus sp. AH-601-O20]MDA7437217.1 hypothetical protein [Synechococcus sp. AH-601-P06]